MYKLKLSDFRDSQRLYSYKARSYLEIISMNNMNTLYKLKLNIGSTVFFSLLCGRRGWCLNNDILI